MKLDENSPRLKLEYPCEWVYKVIGTSRDAIQKAIAEVLKGKQHKVELSNKSRTGKYCCLNIELMVDSEEERDKFYAAFKTRSGIVMVI